MIKYEYISIAIPDSVDDTIKLLNEYGNTGWCMTVMYNGFIFFERRTKVKVR